MKKLTSLLKTTGLAAIGGLLLAAGASAGADPVKESAAKPEAPAAVQAPEKTAAAPCDENAADKRFCGKLFLQKHKGKHQRNHHTELIHRNDF